MRQKRSKVVDSKPGDHISFAELDDRPAVEGTVVSREARQCRSQDHLGDRVQRHGVGGVAGRVGGGEVNEDFEKRLKGYMEELHKAAEGTSVALLTVVVGVEPHIKPVTVLETYKKPVAVSEGGALLTRVMKNDKR